MKVRVSVDAVRAVITLDNNWTPELLGTLMRQCGDEVLRVCHCLGLSEDDPDNDTAVMPEIGGETDSPD